MNDLLILSDSSFQIVSFDFMNLSGALWSSLLVTALVSAICIYIGVKIKKLNPAESPTGIVLVAVIGVESFNNFIKGYYKKEQTILIPYLLAIFLFAMLANIVSLIGLNPPFTNLGIAMSFSLMTFVIIQFNGLKFNGLIDRFKAWVGPVPLLAPIMIPINLIGELSTPISMGFRLFGNLVSGAIITVLVFSLLDQWWFVNVPLSLISSTVLLHPMFDVAFGLIQAVVFFMLSTIFISLAIDND